MHGMLVQKTKKTLENEISGKKEQFTTHDLLDLIHMAIKKLETRYLILSVERHCQSAKKVYISLGIHELTLCQFCTTVDRYILTCAVWCSAYMKVWWVSGYQLCCDKTNVCYCY